jgi:hypothetical protein
VRLIWHFLKRILYYDVPISISGAFVTWIGHRSGADWITILSELGVRYLIITCTVGYIFSVLLYIWFGRRELPIYLVQGTHLYTIIVYSLFYLVLSACMVGFVSSVSIGWIRQ